MWSSDYIIISLIKIIMDNNENTKPEEEEKKNEEGMPEMAPETPTTDAPVAPEEETLAM